MSLRSSSQQLPIICQMPSAPAMNRNRHKRSVTCVLYRYAMSLMRGTVSLGLGLDRFK